MQLHILLHWDDLLRRPGRGKPAPLDVVHGVVAREGATLDDVTHVTVYRRQPRHRDAPTTKQQLDGWADRHKGELRSALPAAPASEVTLHVEWKRPDGGWTCKGYESSIACDALLRVAGDAGTRVVLVTDSAEFRTVETHVAALADGAADRFAMLSWDDVIAA